MIKLHNYQLTNRKKLVLLLNYSQTLVIKKKLKILFIQIFY